MVGFEHLIDIARTSLTSHLQSSSLPKSKHKTPSQPLFVTLRTPNGALRGCIGHLNTQHKTIEEEVADCALAAGLKDPRFPPVQLKDIAGLQIEISILEAPEPVNNLRELDPQAYGVIVTNGARRGVLLPAITGVDTVDDQLRITRQKAGIPSSEPITIERFMVLKISARDE